MSPCPSMQSYPHRGLPPSLPRSHSSSWPCSSSSPTPPRSCPVRCVSRYPSSLGSTSGVLSFTAVPFAMRNPEGAPELLLDRWSCWTGEAAGQVGLLDRWGCWTGGTAGQVGLLDRWGCWTGGAAGQVGLLDRWGCWTGGAAGQVGLLDRWGFWSGGATGAFLAVAGTANSFLVAAGTASTFLAGLGRQFPGGAMGFRSGGD
ncbi:unnamed protein product [Closterium sp. NIES-54]